MAPGTRRAHRAGYAEHDDFEGLPVRQWRQDIVNVKPPPPQEQHQQNDIWAIELIHGMPKDSNLLANHSQELLRAARSGRLYKRPPPEEEEIDPDALLSEKPEKKEDDTSAKGFSVKLWKQIPRNVESSTLSHLAKRRKNTITIASKTVDERAPGPTVTRATVRKVDAAGNPYTEEVTLGDGQNVQGEIISTRVEAVQSGVPDPTAFVQPPQRRRPPPPKRKSKAGPGRGKKKLRNPLAGQGLPTGAVPGADGVVLVKAEGEAQDALKQEGDGTPNPDSEMADGDEEDDEDEEGSDEGDDAEEGEGGEGDESVQEQGQDGPADTPNLDQEMTDAVPAVASALPPAVSESPDVDMGDSTPSDSIPPNPLTLAPPLGSLASAEPKLEGSPLKNVLVPPAEPPVIEGHPLADALDVMEVQMTESTVAEPPSTIMGDDRQVSVERAIPHVEAVTEVTTEEALLPPPPDQVGNISSPKAEDRPAPTEGETKESDKEEPQSVGELLAEKPVLRHQDSVMTEDSLKPDDSASVGVPVTESGEPSEVGAPAEEARGSALSMEPVVGETKLASPASNAPPSVEEPDLLGGLMGELDRQASSVDAPAPALEVVAVEAEVLHVESEPTPELAPEPAPEPVSEPVSEPVPEPTLPEVVPIEEPASEVAEQPADPSLEKTDFKVTEVKIDSIATEDKGDLDAIVEKVDTVITADEIEEADGALSEKLKESSEEGAQPKPEEGSSSNAQVGGPETSEA